MVGIKWLKFWTMPLNWANNSSKALRLWRICRKLRKWPMQINNCKKLSSNRLIRSIQITRAAMVAEETELNLRVQVKNRKVNWLIWGILSCWRMLMLTWNWGQIWILRKLVDSCTRLRKDGTLPKIATSTSNTIKRTNSCKTSCQTSIKEWTNGVKIRHPESRRYLTKTLWIMQSAQVLYVWLAKTTKIRKRWNVANSLPFWKKTVQTHHSTPPRPTS